MEYLIRSAQQHEDFREAEIKALATLHGFDVEILSYSNESPYCVVRLPSDDAAKLLIERSILACAIYRLWGQGSDYDSLHEDLRSRTESEWSKYKVSSFWFQIKTFQSKRSATARQDIVESFSYLPFDGPITPQNPDVEFCVCEYFDKGTLTPKQIYMGRLIGNSCRDVINVYDLKKRSYISTTSMDAELALVTANLALAGPNKLMYDPFVGTAGFPIACAHFGCIVLGSDIDGRCIRGKGEKDVLSNFRQYGIAGRWLDGFTADLTNTPLRKRRFLDAIVCDPPYGVREGLKVLGSKRGPVEEVYIDGKSAYKQADYVPPKKQYSFTAMLRDILQFGADTLVDNGRVVLWMPTANDADVELPFPQNPYLELVSVSVQEFNKWSRRLLVYRRLPSVEVDAAAISAYNHQAGHTADELNDFRRKYFQGFKS
ncbi:tRNA guanosine-2'-O-methyltransferase [Eremomyces bilateralis CBS 781.70]|uniref:tRNA (guanine(10)-N(2))-methyltransferase n=1 Tax=Eremomyces bilateralis CBS 781.70 TaxID=1392243 RepID=A0A6G1G8R2_9PEZI|nr:tRNA guanosine-2'-O-methyltransferase [Eremomyces bilateralis CBS 781.70]KAF1814311.1 tRNA guanosine-2'-O-methyltransferase [Eremomyces bilateralis CBS 781.70]